MATLSDFINATTQVIASDRITEGYLKFSGYPNVTKTLLTFVIWCDAIEQEYNKLLDTEEWKMRCKSLIDQGKEQLVKEMNKIIGINLTSLEALYSFRVSRYEERIGRTGMIIDIYGKTPELYPVEKLASIPELELASLPVSHQSAMHTEQQNAEIKTRLDLIETIRKTPILQQYRHLIGDEDAMKTIELFIKADIRILTLYRDNHEKKYEIVKREIAKVETAALNSGYMALLSLVDVLNRKHTNYEIAFQSSSPCCTIS